MARKKRVAADVVCHAEWGVVGERKRLGNLGRLGSLGKLGSLERAVLNLLKLLKLLNFLNLFVTLCY